MSLMSKIYRGLQGGFDSVAAKADPMNFENPSMPLSNAGFGGLMGAGLGAASNPDDPFSGAAAGAGIGAAGGLGASGVGLAGAALRGFARGAFAPAKVMREVSELAQRGLKEEAVRVGFSKGLTAEQIQIAIRSRI